MGADDEWTSEGSCAALRSPVNATGQFQDFLRKELFALHARVCEEHRRCGAAPENGHVPPEYDAWPTAPFSREAAQEPVCLELDYMSERDSSKQRCRPAPIDGLFDDSEYGMGETSMQSPHIRINFHNFPSEDANDVPRRPAVRKTIRRGSRKSTLTLNSDCLSNFGPVSPKGMRTRRRSTDADTPRSCGTAAQLVDNVTDGAVFLLQPVWQEEIDSLMLRGAPTSRPSSLLGGASETRSVTSFCTTSSGLEIDNDTWLERKASRSCLNNWVSHPNSKRRLAWDLLGMVFVGYDIIMIPLMVFEPPDTVLSKAIDRALIIFWTIDLPASFLVGYHKAGLLVLNVVKIAKKYILSWFPLDLFLLSMEWMVAFAEAEEEEQGFESVGLARLGKTIRVARVLRLFRLLRLMKLPKYFVHLEEHIQSEFSSVVIGISKLTACVLVLNHFIACLWYWVGTSFDDFGDPLEPSWVETLDWPQNTTGAYRYATSLHWSLTQFTPASMEVHPQNVQERSFAIIVLIFALVTFSSFVSSITNAMTRLRHLNSECAKQLLQFQRFIRFHKISTKLAVRMRRHLEHRLLRTDRHIDEKDVECVCLLSEPLRMELHLEVHSPILQLHPFFRMYSEENQQAMKRVCHSCVREIALSYGDILFSIGDAADGMYWVKSGLLRYLPENHDGSTLEDAKHGDWLSEASLWTRWAHVGEAICQTRTVVVVLEAEEFCRVAKAARSFKARPARYAELYVRHLNNLSEWQLSDMFDGFDFDSAVDITRDLSFPFEQWSSRRDSVASGNASPTALVQKVRSGEETDTVSPPAATPPVLQSTTVEL